MTLDERVDKLERDNRFLRRVSFVLMAVVAACTTFAILAMRVALLRPEGVSYVPASMRAVEEETVDTLRVRHLLVVDANGEVRIKLDANDYGGTLKIWGSDGSTSDRIALRAHGHGGELQIQGSGGGKCWMMTSGSEGFLAVADANYDVIVGGGGGIEVLSPDGGSAVLVKGPKGENRTIIGSSFVSVANSSGKEVVSMQLNKKDEGGVYLTDANGRNTILLGGRMISVLNPFDKEVVSIQSNKANEGAVYVMGLNGELKKAMVGD